MRQAANGSGRQFASWFLEIWGRRSHRLNEACRRFIPFMRANSWEEVRMEMPKGLHTKGAFDGPKAGRFYASFRKAVLLRIDRWWREFVKAGKW